MSESVERIYVGDGKQHYPPLLDEDVLKYPEPYVPDMKLIEAVNIALYLRRPLLLEGEPGCGKTRLAHAIAYELGYPLKECYIRSTSRAQDLLYTYDAVRRLYDIQERNVEHRSRLKEMPDQIDGEAIQETLPLKKYVTLGKLGDAIRLAEETIPSVVLIDEIDKADIDFPNDLLQVLDRMQFEVSEVGDWKFDALLGKGREERRVFLPLFLVTSNREKELPKPFLRRCVYYYIDFPNREFLEAIVKKHFQREVTSLFDQALLRFWQLREINTFSWRKIPSTSELLDWIAVLERGEQTGKMRAQDIATIPLWDLPYLETLVKTQSDRNALKRLEE